MPEGLKDKDGMYTGFAGRLRVIIYNTDQMANGADVFTSGGVVGYGQKQLTGQGAIAKPMYGTTLSHYAVLWNELGGEGLKKWHKDWRDGGIVEKGGNSTVKNLVANGVCQWGWTDTDDFYVGKDEGKPVEMLPVIVNGNEKGYVANRGGSGQAMDDLYSEYGCEGEGCEAREECGEVD